MDHVARQWKAAATLNVHIWEIAVTGIGQDLLPPVVVHYPRTRQASFRCTSINRVRFTRCALWSVRLCKDEAVVFRLGHVRRDDGPLRQRRVLTIA